MACTDLTSDALKSEGQSYVDSPGTSPNPIGGTGNGGVTGSPGSLVSGGNETLTLGNARSESLYSKYTNRYYL